MNIYITSGDPDYITIHFTSDDEIAPIEAVDLFNKRIPPDHVVHIRYAYGLPEAEGVVNDSPFAGLGSALVLSRRAQDVLAPMLDQAGALAPVDPAHPMGFKMFVCYKTIDALDIGRTVFMPDSSAIVQFEFDPNALVGADVFRLPRRAGRLYVSERFVQTVREHRLSGFRFRHVWSSETGGIPIDPDALHDRFPPGGGRTLREKRAAMRAYIAETEANVPLIPSAG